MYNSQNNLILNEEIEKQKTNRKIKKIMLLNGQIEKKRLQKIIKKLKK